MPTMFRAPAGQPGRFRLDRRLLDRGRGIAGRVLREDTRCDPTGDAELRILSPGQLSPAPQRPRNLRPGGCRNAGQRPRLHTLPGRGRPRQGTFTADKVMTAISRDLRHADVGAHALPLSANSAVQSGFADRATASPGWSRGPTVRVPTGGPDGSTRSTRSSSYNLAPARR